ncbi:MAG: hypothetical protein ACOYLE_08395 [Bacteroidales bacterium]
MSASIIASFLSFLLTGILTFRLVSVNVNLNTDIKIALFIALFANAFYFFYMEALTEVKPAIKDRIKDKHISQWFIRIINQTILFSLWFLLEFNLLLFTLGLTFLYILFIVWDIITNEKKNNKELFVIDIIGAIYSILFFVLTFFVIDTPPIKTQAISGVIVQPGTLSSLHFWWSSSVWGYVFIPILGIFLTKFELFKSEYWLRKNIY